MNKKVLRILLACFFCLATTVHSASLFTLEHDASAPPFEGYSTRSTVSYTRSPFDSPFLELMFHPTSTTTEPYYLLFFQAEMNDSSHQEFMVLFHRHFLRVFGYNPTTGALTKIPEASERPYQSESSSTSLYPLGVSISRGEVSLSVYYDSTYVPEIMGRAPLNDLIDIKKVTGYFLPEGHRIQESTGGVTDYHTSILGSVDAHLAPAPWYIPSSSRFSSYQSYRTWHTAPPLTREVTVRTDTEFIGSHASQGALHIVFEKKRPDGALYDYPMTLIFNNDGVMQLYTHQNGTDYESIAFPVTPAVTFGTTLSTTILPLSFHITRNHIEMRNRDTGASLGTLIHTPTSGDTSHSLNDPHIIRIKKIAFSSKQTFRMNPDVTVTYGEDPIDDANSLTLGAFDNPRHTNPKWLAHSLDPLQSQMVTGQLYGAQHVPLHLLLANSGGTVRYSVRIDPHSERISIIKHTGTTEETLKFIEMTADDNPIKYMFGGTPQSFTMKLYGTDNPSAASRSSFISFQLGDIYLYAVDVRNDTLSQLHYADITQLGFKYTEPTPTLTPPSLVAQILDTAVATIPYEELLPPPPAGATILGYAPSLSLFAEDPGDPTSFLRIPAADHGNFEGALTYIGDEAPYSPTITFVLMPYSSNSYATLAHEYELEVTLKKNGNANEGHIRLNRLHREGSTQTRTVVTEQHLDLSGDHPFKKILAGEKQPFSLHVHGDTDRGAVTTKTKPASRLLSLTVGSGSDQFTWSSVDEYGPSTSQISQMLIRMSENYDTGDAVPEPLAFLFDPITTSSVPSYDFENDVATNAQLTVGYAPNQQITWLGAQSLAPASGGMIIGNIGFNHTDQVRPMARIHLTDVAGTNRYGIEIICNVGGNPDIAHLTYSRFDGGGDAHTVLTVKTNTPEGAPFRRLAQGGFENFTLLWHRTGGQGQLTFIFGNGEEFCYQFPADASPHTDAARVAIMAGENDPNKQYIDLLTASNINISSIPSPLPARLFTVKTGSNYTGQNLRINRSVFALPTPNEGEIHTTMRYLDPDTTNAEMRINVEADGGIYVIALNLTNGTINLEKHHGDAVESIGSTTLADHTDPGHPFARMLAGETIPVSLSLYHGIFRIAVGDIEWDAIDGAPLSGTQHFDFTTLVARAAEFTVTSLSTRPTVSGWRPIETGSNAPVTINERHFLLDADFVIPQSDGLPQNGPILEFETNETGVLYHLRMGVNNDWFMLYRQEPESDFSFVEGTEMVPPFQDDNRFHYTVSFRDHTLTLLITDPDSGEELIAPVSISLAYDHGITTVTDARWIIAESSSQRYFVGSNTVTPSTPTLFDTFQAEAAALIDALINITDAHRADYEQYLDVETIKGDLNYLATAATTPAANITTMDRTIAQIHRLVTAKMSEPYASNFMASGTLFLTPDADDEKLCLFYIGAQGLELSRISNTELRITYKQQQYGTIDDRYTVADDFSLSATHPAYRCLNGEDGFTKWWVSCNHGVISLGLGTDPGIDPIWQHVDLYLITPHPTIPVLFNVSVEYSATLPQRTITQAPTGRTFELQTNQTRTTPLIRRTNDADPPETVQHPFVMPLFTTEDYYAATFTVRQDSGHAALVELYHATETESTKTYTLSLDNGVATLTDHFADDTIKSASYFLPPDGSSATYWLLQYKNGFAIGTGTDFTFETSILTSYNEVIIDEVLTDHPSLTHLAISGLDAQPKQLSNISEWDTKINNLRISFMPNVATGLNHYDGEQYSSRLSLSYGDEVPFWPLRREPIDTNGSAPWTTTITLNRYLPSLGIHSRPQPLILFSEDPINLNAEMRLLLYEQPNTDGSYNTEIRFVVYHSSTDEDITTPRQYMQHELSGTYTISYDEEAQTLTVTAEDHGESYIFDVREALAGKHIRYMSLEEGAGHPIFMTQPHSAVGEYANYYNFMLNADQLITQLQTLAGSTRKTLLDERSFRQSTEFSLDYAAAQAEVSDDPIKTSLLNEKEQQIYEAIGVRAFEHYSLRTSITPAATGNSEITFNFLFGTELGTITFVADRTNNRIELRTTLPGQTPEPIFFEAAEWETHPLWGNWFTTTGDGINKDIWIIYDGTNADGMQGVLTIGVGTNIGTDPIHAIDLRTTDLSNPLFDTVSGISNMIIDGVLVPDMSSYRQGQANISLAAAPTTRTFSNQSPSHTPIIHPISFNETTGEWQASFTLDQDTQHTFTLETALDTAEPVYRIFANADGVLTISYIAADGDEHIIAVQNHPLTGGAIGIDATLATYWIAYEQGKIALGRGAAPFTNLLIAGQHPENKLDLFSSITIARNGPEQKTFSAYTNSTQLTDWSSVAFNITAELTPDSFRIDGSTSSRFTLPTHTFGIFLTNESTMESAPNFLDPSNALYSIIAIYDDTHPNDFTVTVHRDTFDTHLFQKTISLSDNPDLATVIANWRSGTSIPFSIEYHNSNTDHIADEHGSMGPLVALSFGLQQSPGAATTPLLSFVDTHPVAAALDRMTMYTADRNVTYSEVSDTDYDGTAMAAAMGNFYAFKQQYVTILGGIDSLVHPALSRIPTELPDIPALTAELNDAGLVDQADEARALKDDLDHQLAWRHIALTEQATTQLNSLLTSAATKYTSILSPDITDEELEAIEQIDPLTIANTKTELTYAALSDIPEVITLPVTIAGVTITDDAPAAVTSNISSINALVSGIEDALITLAISTLNNTEVDEVTEEPLQENTTYIIDQAAMRVSDSRGVRDIQIGAIALITSTLQQSSTGDIASLISDSMLDLANESAITLALNTFLQVDQTVTDYDLSDIQQVVIHDTVATVKDTMIAQRNILATLEQQAVHVTTEHDKIRTSVKTDLDNYSADLALDEQVTLLTEQTKNTIQDLLQPYLDHPHTSIAIAASTAHAQHLTTITSFYDATIALVAQRYLQLRSISDCSATRVLAAVDRIRNTLDGFQTPDAASSYDLSEFNALLSSARTAFSNNSDDETLLDRQETIVDEVIAYRQTTLIAHAALAAITDSSGSAVDLMTRLQAPSVTSLDALAAVDSTLFTDQVETLEGIVQAQTPALARSLNVADSGRILRELALYKGLVNATAIYQHHKIVQSPAYSETIEEMHTLLNSLLEKHIEIEAMDITELQAEADNLTRKESVLIALQDSLHELDLFDREDPDSPTSLYRNGIQLAIKKRNLSLNQETYAALYREEQGILESIQGIIHEDVFSPDERTRLLSELQAIDYATPLLYSDVAADINHFTHRFLDQPEGLLFHLVRKSSPYKRVDLCVQSIASALEQHDSLSLLARLTLHAFEMSYRSTLFLSSAALAARWSDAENQVLVTEGSTVRSALEETLTRISAPTLEEEERFKPIQASNLAEEPRTTLIYIQNQLEQMEATHTANTALLAATQTKLFELSQLNNAARITEKAILKSELENQVALDTPGAALWSQADALKALAETTRAHDLVYEINKALFSLKKITAQAANDLAPPPPLEAGESIKVPEIVYDWSGPASRTLTFTPGLSGMVARFYLRSFEGRGYAIGLRYQHQEGHMAEYSFTLGEENNTNTTLLRRDVATSEFLFGNDTSINGIGTPDTDDFVFYHFEQVGTKIHLLRYNPDEEKFVTVVATNDPAIGRDATTPFTLSFHKIARQGEYLEIKNLSLEPAATHTAASTSPLSPTATATTPQIPTLAPTTEETAALDAFNALIQSKDDRLENITTALVLPPAITVAEVTALEGLFDEAYNAMVLAATTNEAFNALPTTMQDGYFAAAQASNESRIEQAEAARIALAEALDLRRQALAVDAVMVAEQLLKNTLEPLRTLTKQARDAAKAEDIPSKITALDDAVIQAIENAFTAAGLTGDPRITGATSEITKALTELNEEIDKASVLLTSIIALEGNVLSIPPHAGTNFITMPHAKVNGKNGRRVTIAADGTDGITLRFADRVGNTYRFRIDQSGIHRSMNSSIDTTTKAFNSSINFSNHATGDLRNNTYQVTLTTMSENVMRDGKNVEQLHISFTFTQQLIEGTQTKTRRARTSFVVEPNPKHAHLLYLPHQYTLAANATQARVEPLNELPDKPEASTALTVSSSGIVSPAAHIDAARVYRAPTINSNRGLRL